MAEDTSLAFGSGWTAHGCIYPNNNNNNNNNNYYYYYYYYCYYYYIRWDDG